MGRYIAKNTTKSVQNLTEQNRNVLSVLVNSSQMPLVIDEKVNTVCFVFG